MFTIVFCICRLNGKDKEVYEALIAVYPPSEDITTNIISLKDVSIVIMPN